MGRQSSLTNDALSYASVACLSRTLEIFISMFSHWCGFGVCVTFLGLFAAHVKRAISSISRANLVGSATACCGLFESALAALGNHSSAPGSIKRLSSRLRLVVIVRCGFCLALESGVYCM